MGKYRICLYGISLNEAALVDRFMDAAREADCVTVLDLGSTDGTVERLRARGAQVYQQLVEPFRFDEARNRALELAPEDADLCVSADLDEVFDPGWRARLESRWRPLYTRACCAYFPDEAAGASYPVERIHRRRGFRWTHPVHETLAYDGGDPDLSARVEGMCLRRQGGGWELPREEYQKLLGWAAEEAPEDSRAAFFLGRGHYRAGRYDKCVAALIRHLGLPAATWDEERAASACYIAQSLSALGHPGAARAWFYRAVGECPRAREPYYRAAVFGYRSEDWALCRFMVDRLLRIPGSTGSYLADPEAYGGLPHDIGAVAAHHMGMRAEALARARRALALSPGDRRIIENIALIEAMGKEAAHGQL